MSSLANMQTGNPAFTMGGTVFDDWARTDSRSTTMTVAGTATKALGLLAICVACAGVSWTQVSQGEQMGGLAMGAAIAGLVLGLFTCFVPKWAMITAPLYSAAQGFFLGAISRFFDMRYPGIALQAVGLTFATSMIMLFMYASRMVRVTPVFTRLVVAATGALFLVYLVTFILSLFGVHIGFIHGAGPIGLAVSAFAIGLAALNLLLDFDFIESKAAEGAPKTLEWYGAFGLMVTLIWLYIEILRLLAKLQGSRR